MYGLVDVDVFPFKGDWLVCIELYGGGSLNGFVTGFEDIELPKVGGEAAELSAVSGG